MLHNFKPNDIILGLDTETTGLPNKNLEATDPRQARVVQLALKLITIEGRVLSQFSTLIKPSGWAEIHPKAFETHGISREDCERFGIKAIEAFSVFQQYSSLSDVIVAHNADFDSVMMMIEADALGIDMPVNPWHCTMKEATPICKVPPTPRMRAAGFGPYKNANLTEALKILCGKDLDGAHDAMVDVTGCLEVLVALRQRKAA